MRSTAAGSEGCSGTPKTCLPEFTGSSGPHGEISPLVANGLVFTAGTAWDAAGADNCTAQVPSTCQPIAITGAGTYTTTVSHGTLLVRNASGIVAFKLP